MPSIMDENRDFRKQMGCMNGISQLFDRHHYLTSWRISSNTNKKLLLGTHHQLDSQHTTRAAVEKVQDSQQLKQRFSMDSSRTAYSSSTCSSTLSSLGSHDTAGHKSLPQRKNFVHEGRLDLRDVVKGSMHREARCLPVKIQTNDKSRGHVMKHVDSPRPMQHHRSLKPETTASEGSTRFLAKFQEIAKNTKDAPLELPRFSYDGRESRETFQSTMKNKELPRLSLDSKASSTKCSLLRSRSDLLSRDYLQMEGESYSQTRSLKAETGSQNRSSGVVAKLMGLDDFPDTISAKKSRIINVENCPKNTILSKSSTKIEKCKQNQVLYSPRASQNNPTSPSSLLQGASSIRKPTELSRFPMEPAPWRQQNPTQGSQRNAQRSRKAPTITQHLSSSVYGEIERRVTELEFTNSGKDLRALKQILEKMKKTRERLENQIGESAVVTSQRRCNLEDSLSEQNSSLSMWQNSNDNQNVPNTIGPRTPKHSVSYIAIKKPTKEIEEKNLSSSNQLTEMGIRRQRIQTPDLKHERENSAHRQKAQDLTPRNNYLKYTSRQHPSIDNRTVRRTLELAGTLKAPQLMKAENCSGRNLVVLSERLRKKLPHREGKSNATVATPSDSGKVKSHAKKKTVEKGLQNKKRSTKSKYPEPSDDQLSDFSSETRFSSYQGDSASVKSESNNSLASQTEIEVTSFSHSTNLTANHHQNSVSTFIENIPAAELAVAMQEQPSPVSVLDAALCGEDSPSPVKKISTAFRDQSPSPDEINWHLENLNHFIGCPISDRRHVVHETRLLKSESEELAQNQNEIGCGFPNPNRRYINKILHASGFLKGASFIPMAGQFLSSCHVINPDMFNVLEQMEETMPRANKESTEKDSQKLLNQKIGRRIVFDLVNEVLVQKVTSGRTFTTGKKTISPPVLAKEICWEMERLCRVPENNYGEEDDGLKRILMGDMMYQSEDWAEYRGEIPALVLDIERRIFKDLVNELVSTDQKHCKQLFTM
ncbi:protein LONGIFOLIA 1 [Dorcoceras hygrometricum]|uniref:Protein LONGIFOLIA 1 n=1 Tax=Dorcoceras hygrometricum TaxID=472368 RepID=A0A2Z7CFA6_9LAMI|nr:protein LONGIFOLIA 1 [Dorcoceras hygrometricum]